MVMSSASVDDDCRLQQARRDYLWVSIWFGIGHGCVTTPVVFATSALGEHIGSIGNSALFAAMLFCGLCISVKASAVLGIQKALGVGMAFNVVYIGSFVLAVEALSAGDHESALFTFTAGSVCGGFGAALLWTSQGGFLSRSAAMLASIQKDTKLEDASAELASMFGFWFLAFEVACKLGFTGLQVAGLRLRSAASAYGLIAAGSALALGTTSRVPPESDVNTSGGSKFLATVSLWTNPLIWLTGFTSVTFGLCAAYVNGYVTAHFATKTLGKSHLGALSALTCAAGALFIKLFDAIIASIGKVNVVTLGTACMALLVVISECTTWTDQKAVIVLIFVLQGAGRAVYESVNRSIFADRFRGENTEGAFANMYFQMSMSSIVGYALLSVNPTLVGSAALLCALLAPVALRVADRIDATRLEDHTTELRMRTPFSQENVDGVKA
eukprot:TRINITY_DN77142_c0_g1_i1.p1 TRINITY_DN77142_c0_g1~~TRINITY_DN77142_c0_g1_i1.p1  ORF type:complete len:442 (+),score=45.39 TRINITY_DN77142_c0_g1_i1:26-1351(+)